MAAQSSFAQELVYNSKPGATPAAVVRVNTPPFNKDDFSRGNETISINIPSWKRGQYLDPIMSYLKFQLEVELNKNLGIENYNRSTELSAKSVPIIALDGGAHSLFTSLEVRHGFNALEQIHEYTALYQLLMDQGEDVDGSRVYKGGRSLVEGVSPLGGRYDRGGVIVSDVQILVTSGTHQTTPNGLTGPYYIRNPAEVDVTAKSITKSNNLNTVVLSGEQAYNSYIGGSALPRGEFFGIGSLPNFDKPRRRTFTFCMCLSSPESWVPGCRNMSRSGF
jgi:hypothetical protein